MKHLSLLARTAAAGLTLTLVMAAQQPDLYDLMTVRTLHLGFGQANWWDQLLSNKSSETYIRASLKVDGRLYQDVGVRFRGGSSYAFPRHLNSRKLPFKISMDEFVSDQELYGYTKLDLNNGFWDPTFMREVLAMKLMREYLPAPQANLVKLVINNENWGIYINMQPPNSEFVRDWFRNTTGNRYKGFQPFTYRGTLLSSYAAAFPLMSKPKAGTHQELMAALATTIATPFSQLDVEKLIDVDMAHRHLAVNYLTGNNDGLPSHNYYIYADPYHGQLALIPWDLNVAFWHSRIGIFGPPPDPVPGLFGNTDLWKRRYKGHLRTMVERDLSATKIAQWVLPLVQKIDAEVQADTKKLYSYKDFRDNLDGGTTSVGLSSVDGLRVTIEGRLAEFLKMAFMKAPRVTLANPTRTAGTAGSHQITVRASSTAAIQRVLLHYRSQGHYLELPMLDDGNSGDGKANDGVFGATLPAQTAGALVQYYFSGETSLAQGGDINYLPFCGAHGAYSFRVPPKRTSVLVHEVLARNDKGLRDGAGDRDDWIELFNPTLATVDLSGMYLSDSSAEPTKWMFPQGTTIPAGGRLLLWADEESSEGKLHTSFKLSGDGEEVALVDRDGKTLLDLVVFGPQSKDTSFGQLFDRSSVHVALLDPTPGSRNELDPCGVRRWSVPDHATTATHTMKLDARALAAGGFKIGSRLSLELSDAPSNSAYLLQVSLDPGLQPLPVLGISRLLGQPLVEVVLPTGPQGQSSLPFEVPDQQALVGFKLSFQAIAHDSQRLVASNGVELGFCGK